MNKLKNNRNDGFTLIELLVVSGMLLFVLAAVYSLYETSRRTANVEENVIDLQQNLRIAMDSITRDVRMAGFLAAPSVNYGVKNAGPFSMGDQSWTGSPIGGVNDNQGALQLLPPPDNVPSDLMTLNVASTTSTYAAINQQHFGTGAFIVDTPDAADQFNIGDAVKIIRPQPFKYEPGDVGAWYSVQGTTRNPPSITLGNLPGFAGSNGAANYMPGDMIAKTTAGANLPTTITYCLGSSAGVPPGVQPCGAPVPTCPQGQLCLMRIVNGITPTVVADSIAGFQLQYVFDDAAPQNNASARNGAPNDIGSIRAIKVIISGITPDPKGGVNKVRQMQGIVQLRTR